jgi:flagellar operon protein (TIGR03826 family)
MKGVTALDLKNCPECGKLFVQVSRNLCPACVEQEEKDFEAVAGYLRNHEDADITETSEATGVIEERIITFLRDGRLEAKGAISLELKCERCGRPISSGRFCEGCTNNLIREIQAAVRPPESQAPKSQAPKSEGSERISGLRQRYHTADRYKK